MTIVSGSVERITYYNKENGYTVLRLRPESDGNQAIPGVNLDGLLTVVGNLPEISPGTQIKLEGEYGTHPKHGLQFEAKVCEQILPVSVKGIERYLGSGLIKGIGPQLAKLIVSHFKKDTLDIIENHPSQLKQVPGIGEDRTEKIIKAWKEQKQVKELMLFLHAHSVSTNLAVKIYKTYGDQALEIVKSNPYQLEEDIFGVGFRTADHIAQSLGLPKDHPSRIETGIVFVLNQAVNDGHIFLPRQALISDASNLLDIEPNLVWAGLERLIQDERVKQEPIVESEQESDPQIIAQAGDIQEVSDKVGIYLTPYYYAEITVAKIITELMKHIPKPAQGSLVFESELLSAQQRTSLEIALSSPVSIITGGPGTGKTTCLKSLIQRLEANHHRYALASPTGRAAKRLSEATLKPASTIHRLLAFSPVQGFQYHEKHPLNIDFLIVDEASMLDLMLIYHLLRAIKPGTQVLFVGDVDQLPSVGAGNVLRDFITSQKIPVSRLTTIYRQTEDSQIISNAHRINQGLVPEFSNSSSGDFFLFPAEDAQQAATWIVDLVSARIPEKFGLDPVKDIQTLTPIYRGEAGVNYLNENLQKVLNPANSKKTEQKITGQIFRVGDKVMQTRNNYDKDIYNGDIGTVTAINRIDQTLNVLIDGVKEIEYDFSEADELVLAYAISIHKSQGSEFPAVVIPILTQHYIMLQRNLLYTAVTRAKTLCVLVGNVRAAHIAINNNKISLRNTSLSNRITMLSDPNTF